MRWPRSEPISRRSSWWALRRSTSTPAPAHSSPWSTISSVSTPDDRPSVSDGGLQAVTEQLAELPGVAHAVVAVAVVEDGVGLAGGAGEVPHLGRPPCQLLAVVEVGEALGGADALGVPRLSVVPVEADHR